MTDKQKTFFVCVVPIPGRKIQPSENQIMSIEKAIQENTVALLDLAASNRELAEAMKQGQTATGTTPKEPAKKPEPKADKPKPSKKDKEPAEKPEAEDKEEEETASDKSEAFEVTADDLRKVAGVLVENDNKAGLQKVLKKFEAKNITAFDKEGGDLAAMLSALEEEAGVKLADITD